MPALLGVSIKYRTAEVGTRVRNTSLYHSRPCGILFEPRSGCIDYTVVCFMTHDYSQILRKQYQCEMGVV